MTKAKNIEFASFIGLPPTLTQNNCERLFSLLSVQGLDAQITLIESCIPAWELSFKSIANHFVGRLGPKNKHRFRQALPLMTWSHKTAQSVIMHAYNGSTSTFVSIDGEPILSLPHLVILDHLGFLDLENKRLADKPALTLTDGVKSFRDLLSTQQMVQIPYIADLYGCYAAEWPYLLCAMKQFCDLLYDDTMMNNPDVLARQIELAWALFAFIPMDHTSPYMVNSFMQCFSLSRTGIWFHSQFIASLGLPDDMITAFASRDNLKTFASIPVPESPFFNGLDLLQNPPGQLALFLSHLAPAVQAKTSDAVMALGGVDVDPAVIEHAMETCSPVNVFGPIIRYLGERDPDRTGEEWDLIPPVNLLCAAKMEQMFKLVLEGTCAGMAVSQSSALVSFVSVAISGIRKRTPEAGDKIAEKLNELLPKISIIEAPAEGYAATAGKYLAVMKTLNSELMNICRWEAQSTPIADFEQAAGVAGLVKELWSLIGECLGAGNREAAARIEAITVELRNGLDGFAKVLTDSEEADLAGEFGALGADLKLAGNDLTALTALAGRLLVISAKIPPAVTRERERNELASDRISAAWERIIEAIPSIPTAGQAESPQSGKPALSVTEQAEVDARLKVEQESADQIRRLNGKIEELKSLVDTKNDELLALRNDNQRMEREHSKRKAAKGDAASVHYDAERRVELQASRLVSLLDDSSPAGVLRAAQSISGGLLQVTDEAWSSAADFKRSEYAPELLMKRLLQLIDIYLPQYLAGGDNLARHVFGGAYAACESASTMKNSKLSQYREFLIGGKMVVVEKHIAVSRFLRIYFTVEDGKVIVPYLGHHLPIRSTN